MDEVTTANSTISNRLKTAVGAVLIIAAIFTVVELLGIKAAANKLTGELEPLPVSTNGLQRYDSYSFPVVFTGSVEPGQQSALSFQISGEIDNITVEEGDIVTEGQVLAKLDTDRLIATIKQLKADIKAREADLELAQLTERRQESLVEDGYTSKQRFDELRLGTLSAAARLDAARAALTSAQVDLDRSVLKAPFNGVIAARRVDIGAVGQAGTAVLDLIETGNTRVRIGLPPEIAKSLRKGDAVEVKHNGEPLAATVFAVRPDIDPATRSQSVLFSLSDTTTALSFGDLVRLQLSQTVNESGFWVPSTSLRAGEKGLWLVYLVEGSDSTGRIRPEAVEILYSNGKRAFVRGNLPDGAQLLAKGVQRVAPGQLVQINPTQVAATTASR